MIVQTTLGPVVGTTGPLGDAWLGIPFAQPPVGPLRFRAPEPALPWRDPRPCDAFGSPAVQFTLPGAPLAEQVVGDEDCLTLNIWRPSGDAEMRPVLVWVHGGGFVLGSGIFFDGGLLAQSTGCVVVTLNYRLGPLGFLYPGSDAGRFDANPALLDIIAALRFVRKNIGAFGGDAEAITLFGESAGAMLIGTLLAMPAAAGLFASAALFSGAASNVHTIARASDIFDSFMQTLGVGSPDLVADASVDDLRRAAAATNTLSTLRPWNAEAFLPVIDGHSLADDPLRALAREEGLSVPLLISTLRDEMSFFVQRVPTLCDGKEVYGRATLGEAEWGRLEIEYAGLPASDAGTRCELLTDAMFAMPAVRLAEFHRGDAWLMRIDTAMDITPFDVLGPSHGQDVYMIWETYFNIGRPVSESTDRDRTVSGKLRDVLVGFAWARRPVVLAGDWPPYDVQSRKVMVFDREPAMQADPTRARRELWRDLLPNGVKI